MLSSHELLVLRIYTRGGISLRAANDSNLGEPRVGFYKNNDQFITGLSYKGGQNIHSRSLLYDACLDLRVKGIEGITPWSHCYYPPVN